MKAQAGSTSSRRCQLSVSGNGEGTFGIVEAAQRARAWAPLARTEGQRLVLLAVVCFVGRDSTASPTSAQLAQVTGYQPSSVRRILKQLESLGAIAQVGQRPVYDRDGAGRGGRVAVWQIPPAPLEDTVPLLPVSDGGDHHPRPGATPLSPPGLPTVSSEGAPLGVEEVESEVFDKSKPVRELIVEAAKNWTMP